MRDIVKIAFLLLGTIILVWAAAHTATRAIVRAQVAASRPTSPVRAFTHTTTQVVNRTLGLPILTKTTHARKSDGSYAILIDYNGNGLHTQTLQIMDAHAGYETWVDFASRTYLQRPISKQQADSLRWAPGTCEMVYAGRTNAKCQPISAFQGHSASRVTFQSGAEDNINDITETVLPDVNWLMVARHEAQLNRKTGATATIDVTTDALHLGEPAEDLFQVPEGLREAKSYSDYDSAYNAARGFKRSFHPEVTIAVRNAVWANAKLAGPLYDATTVKVLPPMGQ